MVFDSRSLAHKDPFGAVAAGVHVTFCVHLPVTVLPQKVFFVLYEADNWNTPKRTQMLHSGFIERSNVYKCHFTPTKPALYFYSFEIIVDSCAVPIKKRGDNIGELGLESGGLWQLTVYDGAMRPPVSLTERGIIYQIFPDRFNYSGERKKLVPKDRWLRDDWGAMPRYLPDENGRVTNSDYFCGDLPGIEQKLDYLKSLGVGVIYLNPIFEAHSNHRYNTADYMKIDPLLGDEEDFKRLCKKAAMMGMQIVLDGVFNHTGSDSIYFNRYKRYGNGGAYNDPSSKYYKWYNFIEYPHSYKSWWGFDDLPEVIESDEDYIEFICGEDGVIKKWLRLGASGYRVDVADELPDVMLDRISAAVKDASLNNCVIGEVWEDASNKISYGRRRRYLLGGQLDSVMNYPLMKAILTFVRYGGGAGLYEALMAVLENYPKPVVDVLMNTLSTHDTERAITMLGGIPREANGREWQAANNTLCPAQYEFGKRLFKLAAVIQYTIPGIPSLYYGDEAGMYGYADPFNRGCYPWGHEDVELIGFFRELGRIRSSCSVFRSGELLPLVFSENVCMYMRRENESTALIAVNRDSKPHEILMSNVPDSAKIYILSGDLNGNLLHDYSAVIMLF